MNTDLITRLNKFAADAEKYEQGGCPAIIYDAIVALEAVSTMKSHNERFNDWWESRERNEFVGVSRFDAKRIWLSALDNIGALK